MSELEKAEQYEYCRFWSRSDGYIHCSDCVNCPDCKNIPEDDTWEYCEYFVVG